MCCLRLQNQRAFQKQDNIFVGKKRSLTKKAGIRETRYYKSVGLGIKTPRTAIEGTYVDKKCPWTGNVNIRGKMITGVIKTTKMKNTIIIRKVTAEPPGARVSLPTASVCSPLPPCPSALCSPPPLSPLPLSPPLQDYLHYIKKYNRFEKRHKNTPVHVSPAFRVKPGDEILAGQCRPLSKTVRFNMLKMIRSAGGDKKGFAGM